MVEDDFGRSVAAGIHHTLQTEARRNELTIADVRVATLFGALGIEAWLLLEGSALGWTAQPLAGLTFAYFLVAIGFRTVLSRKTWHPAFPWIAPTLDLLYYSARQGASLYMVGAENFREDQDLASVVGFGSLLILTCAYRLSGGVVVYVSALVLALYVFFASSIELERFFMTLHIIFLGAAMMATYGLTRQVIRAVQGEVRRLTVARLLPGPVLAQADEDPVALLSRPRSLNATVVITDIRGFTRWAEHRSPLEVLAFLNRVQGGLATIVHEHQGTVDKFMGDGMLAVFGAPVASQDHADRALNAVQAMQDFIASIADVELGVGVHSGELIVGCLGSGVRMEFTILGDTVNTASRLESKTKEVGVPVLISDATRLASSRTLRELHTVEIRGRDQGMLVHTL